MSNPKKIYDSLMHHKDKNGVEEVVFPITRYQALLNAPKVVTDESELNGAPFSFLIEGEIEI